MVTLVAAEGEGVVACAWCSTGRSHSQQNKDDGFPIACMHALVIWHYARFPPTLGQPCPWPGAMGLDAYTYCRPHRNIRCQKPKLVVGTTHLGLRMFSICSMIKVLSGPKVSTGGPGSDGGVRETTGMV